MSEGSPVRSAATVERRWRAERRVRCVEVEKTGLAYRDAASDHCRLRSIKRLSIGPAMAEVTTARVTSATNSRSPMTPAAGAATNPDPEVFAYAAAQVKNALDVTHELGGANYVLWGGREGYETLLNTDMKRELAQLGRFLTMVVEHKEKIGFKGTILIEPKPKEPTKHQYDFDVGTIFGMLKAYDLEKLRQDQH